MSSESGLKGTPCSLVTGPIASLTPRAPFPSSPSLLSRCSPCPSLWTGRWLPNRAFDFAILFLNHPLCCCQSELSEVQIRCRHSAPQKHGAPSGLHPNLLGPAKLFFVDWHHLFQSHFWHCPWPHQPCTLWKEVELALPLMTKHEETRF